MTNFTVLVCNRAKLTKQMLKSLEGTADVTLTIAEDPTCDGETRDILDWAKNGCPNRVQIVNFDMQLGTASLRNHVIQASEKRFGRGSYLYLSDNDVKFNHAAWLNDLIYCYEFAWQHGFKVLGAYNHPYHQHGNRVMVNEKYSVCEVQALALQSMLMRWEVWDQYGPFPETPVGRVCMGEDVEFGWRITKDDGKLGVVDPPLLVNTGITNSFGEKIPGWELVKAQCPEGVYCE